MSVLSELGLGSRGADIAYVEGFVKEMNFSEELKDFLNKKGIFDYFGLKRVNGILQELESDLVVQAIVAGSKLSMAVCEGHGGISPRAREVSGWVPNVSDEIDNWTGFHDDKMIEVIEKILRQK